MNLIEHEVLEILGKPVESHGYWIVPVRTNSWGWIGDTFVYFKSKEEADNLQEGYIYEA